MKFTVEILRHASESTITLQRYVIHGISPKWVKVRAITLLAAWKKRNANGVIIRNNIEEIIHQWRED
jgi:hypothetical protein